MGAGDRRGARDPRPARRARAPKLRANVGREGPARRVALARRTSWDDLKSFARGVAEELAHDRPARYVAAAAKSRRTGRIFIDWLRNGEGATAVASYSTRARPGRRSRHLFAGTSSRRSEAATRVTVANMAKRLTEAGTPGRIFLPEAIHSSVRDPLRQEEPEAGTGGFRKPARRRAART